MDSRAIGEQGRTMGQPLILIRLDHHPEGIGLHAFPLDRQRMCSFQIGNMEKEKGSVTEGSFDMPYVPVVLRGLVCTVFRGPHVPALRKIFGFRLGEELADELRFRDREPFDQRLQCVR
jgi:hypothetical protein